MTAAQLGKKVLVVEDEAIVREAAVEMVREAGFEALQATNGTEAFGILHDVADVAAIVTDIDMPMGIDGIRLAACVHQRWPGIGLIVTSGKIKPRRGDLPSHARFFAKPYDQRRLLTALRRMIASAAQTSPAQTGSAHAPQAGEGAAGAPVTKRG